MKIQIKSVGKGWRPDNAAADFKPIYSIEVVGQSEPQRTQDPALAVPGEHEAETYQTKSGKTYWRSLSAPQAQERIFKADPDKQESIEWQACLKAAVQAVHDYHLLAGTKLTSIADYKKDIVEAVVTFTQTIEKKPVTIASTIDVGEDNPNSMVDQGDYAKVAGVDYDEIPVELRDEIPY